MIRSDMTSKTKWKKKKKKNLWGILCIYNVVIFKKHTRNLPFELTTFPLSGNRIVWRRCSRRPQTRHTHRLFFFFT